MIWGYPTGKSKSLKIVEIEQFDVRCEWQIFFTHI